MRIELTPYARAFLGALERGASLEEAEKHAEHIVMYNRAYSMALEKNATPAEATAFAIHVMEFIEVYELAFNTAISDNVSVERAMEFAELVVTRLAIAVRRRAMQRRAE